MTERVTASGAKGPGAAKDSRPDGDPKAQELSRSLQARPSAVLDEAHLGDIQGAMEAVNSYRDAVRFANGREVRLQELREGQRVRVVDLSLAEELDLEKLREERLEFNFRR